jgi:hypothetical protein
MHSGSSIIVIRLPGSGFPSRYGSNQQTYSPDTA